ncbi:MAG: glycosyltransferase family 2 protein [Halobacteriota archaeon]
MGSIDVIVPCYRYGHFLKECVESVLSQAASNVRVLIIDDASPDNTAEVATELARDDSRVTFLRHATNKGHIATYNEGIDWVSADYMLLLSADDYLLPGALSRATSLMDAYPQVGFTFGNFVTLSHGGTTFQKVGIVGNRSGSRILAGREFIEFSGAHNIVRTPTAVVRSNLQKRLGGYRTDLPHSGDMEMWLRLAAHASVGILDAYQAVYRQHGDNMSLGYDTQGALPDLQQRKACFDYFFRNCSYIIPNAEDLSRRLYWALGCDAIAEANAAFNEGEMVISEKLSDYALFICPGVKVSVTWLMLYCKRGMGLTVWRAIRPAVIGIRQVVSIITGSARFMVKRLALSNFSASSGQSEKGEG